MKTNKSFNSISTVGLELLRSIFSGDTIVNNDIPAIASVIVKKLDPEQQSLLISQLMQIREEEIRDTKLQLDRLTFDKNALRASIGEGFGTFVPMLDRA